MDPWATSNNNINESSLDSFEDNFKPKIGFTKLEDTDVYLAILEKRLKSLHTKKNVVEELSAYRADCINRLLQEGSNLDPIIGNDDQTKLIEKSNSEQSF